MIQKNIDKITR